MQMLAVTNISLVELMACSPWEKSSLVLETYQPLKASTVMDPGEEPKTM